MVCEECKIEPIEPVQAKTEMLTCERCGCLYPYRGKNDPGLCRVCEPIVKALKGGPLNGSSVYHGGGRRHSGLLEEE